MRPNYRVIDADGHVDEKAVDWVTLLPKRFHRDALCEETTIPYVAQMVGEERLLYASDYSHWDCLCPDSVKLLNERTDLSESLKRKLFGENAARLFNL